MHAQTPNLFAAPGSHYVRGKNRDNNPVLLLSFVFALTGEKKTDHKIYLQPLIKTTFVCIIPHSLLYLLVIFFKSYTW